MKKKHHLPQLAATPNQGVSLTGPDGTYTMSGLASQAQDSQSYRPVNFNKSAGKCTGRNAIMQRY